MNKQPYPNPDQKERQQSMNREAMKQARVTDQEEAAEADQPDRAGREAVGRRREAGINRIDGRSVGRDGRNRRRSVALPRRGGWCAPGCAGGRCIWRSGRRRGGAAGRRGIGIRRASGIWLGRGARPRFTEAEAFAQIVQSKWIWQRSAVAARAGSVVSLNHLVKDPAGDEEAEDAVLIR